MKLPIVVRDAMPTERSLVLKDWKGDIAAMKGREAPWKNSLTPEEFWILLNTVIDKLTLPSCRVKMACHELASDTAMAWAAVREGQILHMHCKQSLLDDPELAAHVQRHLQAEVQAVVVPWNPILELRRLP